MGWKDKIFDEEGRRERDRPDGDSWGFWNEFFYGDKARKVYGVAFAIFALWFLMESCDNPSGYTGDDGRD